MKRVILVHGWDGNPKNNWFPWLKKKLESQGFKVIIPAMPETEAPEISKWVNYLKEIVGNSDKDTFFVGHSLGCQAIMRYLETLSEKTKVGGCIFIAPWLFLDKNTIEEEGPESEQIAKPWVETPIIYNKIKNHADKFIAIFSDNDPFVPLENHNIFKKELAAKIIVEKGKGHFDDEAGIKELPIVLNSILEMAK